MITLTNGLVIPASDIEISAIHAQGPGGQNVNKVATAIHLRFDVLASSLPDYYKERLLKLTDQRLTRDAVIVIKAQQGRSQGKSKEEALRRLQELLESVAELPKVRRPTKPTRSSERKRLDVKSSRGKVKAMRAKNRVSETSH